MFSTFFFHSWFFEEVIIKTNQDKRPCATKYCVICQHNPHRFLKVAARLSQRQGQMVGGLTSATFAKGKCLPEQKKGIPAGGSTLHTCVVAFVTQSKRLSACLEIPAHSSLIE